jgi:signal transduction histidine kinase
MRDLAEPDARSRPFHRGRLILLAGLLTAAATVAAGTIAELWVLGRSDGSAFARVERDVRRQVEYLTQSLQASAQDLSRNPEVADAVAAAGGTARLFDLVDAAVDERTAPDLSITVFASGAERAWAGKPSEIPADRVSGPAALFVAPGPLGLRLVYVEPIGRPARLGAVVAERVLSPTRGVRNPATEPVVLTTAVAPVSLRTRYEGAGATLAPHSFVIRSPAGEPLLEARVDPDDLAAARRAWRARVLGAALIVLALTALLFAGPLLDARQTSSRARCAPATGALLALVLVARVLAWWVTPPWGDGRSIFTLQSTQNLAALLLRSPLDVLLTALAASAFVWAAHDWIDRARIAMRRDRRSWDTGPAAFGAFAFGQLAAGGVAVALVAGYGLLLRQIIHRTSVDLLHLSLHPWRAPRLTLIVALFCTSAVVLWFAVAVFRAALLQWRLPRRHWSAAAVVIGLWFAVAVAVAATARVALAPAGVVLPAVGAAALVAWLFPRFLAWMRHAAQPARLLAAFVAILWPALALYPATVAFADRAKRRLVETQYAVQSRPQELQSRFAASQEQIDAIPALDEIVRTLEPPPPRTPVQTDSAFAIWRQTDLAGYRLRSSVELYNQSGFLVSRFALNLPEYSPTNQKWDGQGCAWQTFGEATLFGSEERLLLHAERGICNAAGRTVGAVVVHVGFDYESMPFISSQSPYFELFRTSQFAAVEGTRGRDIELVIYGWGRLPVFISGAGAWPLSEAVFSRIYASRDPFWTRLRRNGEQFHVYFSNDRGGIYALGYPEPTTVDHLAHLAEVATLGGLIYSLLLGATAAFVRLARARPLGARALFRQLRASFYRKLALAFIAAAVIPVLSLALVSRAYFATLLRERVAADAARIVEVARRVITLQARDAAVAFTDDGLLTTSQLIHQDANLFEGPDLIATSERDLFASGLLPTRTPDEVYRAIVLQRLPTFVGEDAIGDFTYLLAAAPVNAAGRNAILTVPLASRQPEIELQIDELDRGVHLAAVLFILVGAFVGFWMAERIADPVKRLTLATRRIARGDFDARIAVRSRDELQRLVDAFNRMAEELKAQRGQLERTHRLEAWAEMARQVAHEIKNPLTPIQLSAEHLRRVHADRGEPLSPVLEDCVDSILGQVRLLRQISAEFSAFASSPTARPTPTAMGVLITEVIEPYRAGLGGRVFIDVDVADPLPLLNVDRTLVARALVNVIENALHAMPGGGVLTIEAAANDGLLSVVVKDSGAGMDSDALRRVFEPYFSTKATGTGLGLTIAKRNIELNGGNVAVTSEKGRGTTVTMTWPI